MVPLDPVPPGASRLSLEGATGPEIRALVSLLGDDDPKIFAMVWDHLLDLGMSAAGYLRDVSESREPRLRLRARQLLSRIHLDDIGRQLEELGRLEDSELDLERGLHLIARLEHADLPRETIREALDSIAEAIRPRLHPGQTGLERVRAFNQVFFDELRFASNPHELYEFDSILLDRVLARRSGTPIALACAYLLVAKRLGLPFHGIGLPNNVLVRYADEGEEIVVDPYLGGKLLSRKDCLQQMTSSGYYLPRESHIVETTSRDLLIRTLRHLVVMYAKHSDKTRVQRLTRFVEILNTRERAR